MGLIGLATAVALVMAVVLIICAADQIAARMTAVDRYIRTLPLGGDEDEP